MLSNRLNNHEDISDGYCECSICISLKMKNSKKQQKQLQMPHKNSLDTFLLYLPRNFPITILSTVLSKQKMFYQTKAGNRLSVAPCSSRISQHFPLPTNLIIFYEYNTKIVHKYELNKQDNNYLYIQAYNTKIPLTVSYRRDQNFMDQVLSQKIIALVKNLTHSQISNFSESDKEFLVWIHKEYLDQIFCKYMIKIFCDYIQAKTSDIILSGQFDWIIQKFGVIKLANVRNLEINVAKKITSFQQEYQQKILERLKLKEESSEIKIFNAFVKKNKINYRVNVFRNGIRQIFQKQKQKILQKTEKQRIVESKTLSDDVAKLFLPELSKYSSLRQVLNDEAKFKKVVLGIQQPAKPQNLPQHMKAFYRSVQKSKKDKSRVLYYKFKTQI